MHSKNYNLIPLSIDQGLNRVPIGTAGGYIRLLEAPAAANVQIHLNEQNADGIPLKTYHAIEATNIEKIFVSCNAVPGEKITVVQANTAKDFKMVTPASDVKLSSLGMYESTALEQLDKILNPYYQTKVNVGTASNSSATTIFSKTMECDKIKVYLTGAFVKVGSGGFQNGSASLIVDGVECISSGGYNGTSGSGTAFIEIEDIKGKTVEIKSYENSSSYLTTFLISEHTLK